jgi:hypothetical protein
MAAHAVASGAATWSYGALANPSAFPPCANDSRTPAAPIWDTVMEGDYLTKIANDLSTRRKWADVYTSNRAINGPDPDAYSRARC